MKQLLKNAKAIVTIFILTICFIGCDNMMIIYLLLLQGLRTL
jgi:hypothetical protein